MLCGRGVLTGGREPCSGTSQIQIGLLYIIPLENHASNEDRWEFSLDFDKDAVPKLCHPRPEGVEPCAPESVNGHTEQCVTYQVNKRASKIHGNQNSNGLEKLDWMRANGIQVKWSSPQELFRGRIIGDQIDCECSFGNSIDDCTVEFLTFKEQEHAETDEYCGQSVTFSDYA